MTTFPGDASDVPQQSVPPLGPAVSREYVPRTDVGAANMLPPFVPPSPHEERPEQLVSEEPEMAPAAAVVEAQGDDPVMVEDLEQAPEPSLDSSPPWLQLVEDREAEVEAESEARFEFEDEPVTAAGPEALGVAFLGMEEEEEEAGAEAEWLPWAEAADDEAEADARAGEPAPAQEDDWSGAAADSELEISPWSPSAWSESASEPAGSPPELPQLDAELHDDLPTFGSEAEPPPTADFDEVLPDPATSWREDAQAASESPMESEPEMAAPWIEDLAEPAGERHGAESNSEPVAPWIQDLDEPAEESGEAEPAVSAPWLQEISGPESEAGDLDSEFDAPWVQELADAAEEAGGEDAEAAWLAEDEAGSPLDLTGGAFSGYGDFGTEAIEAAAAPAWSAGGDADSEVSAAAGGGHPSSASALDTAIDEVAERLERIAASLRSRGAAGLSAQAADPLELLIAGFVMGYSHASRRGEQNR
jgi:hypothetical protein